MKILVTDGNSRAALAITRTLGGKGHEIHVGSGSYQSLAGHSKFCTQVHRYPDPAAERDGFIDSISKLTEANRFDIVIPVADVCVLPIAQHRKQLENQCLIPLPSYDALEMAADKAAITRLADSLGVATPRSVEIEAAIDEPPPELQFPVVIKPSRSRVRTDQGWLHTSVDYADSVRELTGKLEALPAAAYPVLLQERIRGPGIGMFYCFDNGRPIATFAHKRLHEKPPSGGVSVLRESILPHELADDYSKRLLSALNWHGVAMVEFKLDERDQLPKLMEINGRFWGSLQLAIDAGVDFPNLLIKLASGASIDPVFEYKLGVKSRWFWGEIDLLLLYILKNAAQLNLPEGHDSRIVSILKVINPFIRKQRFEVLRPGDIKPWFYETKEWFTG